MPGTTGLPISAMMTDNVRKTLEDLAQRAGEAYIAANRAATKEARQEHFRAARAFHRELAELKAGHSSFANLPEGAGAKARP